MLERRLGALSATLSSKFSDAYTVIEIISAMRER